MLDFLWQAILGLLLLYIIIHTSTILYLLRNFKVVVIRDVIGIVKFCVLMAELTVYQLLDRTVVEVFEETASKNRSKFCIRQGDVSWTFDQMRIYTNKVGNCFRKLGIKEHDEIALLMENRPEYAGIWIGLAKIGATTALLNNNQRDKALIHAITCVKSKAVIFSPEFSSAISVIINELKEQNPDMKFYCLGNPNLEKLDKDVVLIENLIQNESNELPKYKGSFKDKLLYIYTSGTTGLPKASTIRNCRFMMIGYALDKFVGLQRNDVNYCCLPFYHASGGILGMSTWMIRGSTLVVRKKFSASQFWDDCIKYECTTAMYIGELCRYLLSQPEKIQEKQHKVRVFFGNGLRPNVWQPLRKRFGIQNIVEFFGSTEGNTTLVNFVNKDAACGFIPQIIPKFLLKKMFPVKLIKYDENTGNVVRGPDGFCIICKPGETGLLVSNINNKNPIKAFDGYTNKEETKKKILYDAFEKGDMLFLSGDLLEMDEYGFLYFRDRTGDTFRWKGENVSTTEVETLITSVVKLSECICFGVDIAGHEGKACMVALLEEKDHNLDLQNLLQELKNKLPSFALPCFIRMISHVDYTPTFKLQKMQLKKQAYSIDQMADKVYVLNSKKTSYELLDLKMLEDIRLGNVRF